MNGVDALSRASGVLRFARSASGPIQRLPAAAALAVALVGCNDPGDTGSGVQDTDEPSEQRLSHALSPSNGGRGTSMTVMVESTRSVFAFGDTWLTLGDGVSIDAVTVQDGWTAAVDVTIDPDAPLGPRDATLTYGGTEVVLDDAFTVVEESFRIEPDNARMGETAWVAMVGQNTQWEEGYTWTSFGEGVRILDFTVLSPTLAEAWIAVRPDARPGPRDVAMEDGPQVVTMYDGFTVDRAVLTAFWEPPQAYQGQAVAFTIEGLDTNFAADTEIAFWDDGGENADIEVTQLTVMDSDDMYGRIRLSNAARVGMRDVLITTGDESILIPDALEVLDAPPDLSNVYPVIGFDVYRTIDNATGDIAESVEAFAYFLIPLDPPCGAAPPPGSGPQPYDQNGVFPVPPEPEPVDCPNPETVSAGPYIWYEGPENVVTLHRDIIPSTGQIVYRGLDLTLDDYRFDTLYDLAAPGDPTTTPPFPAFVVEEVQPTVPADYTITAPALWGDFTWSRTERLDFGWTPAQTYPDAMFSVQLAGTLAANDEPGFAGVLPWDDGAHHFTPSELAQLNEGPVSFAASSAIQGPYFGLPFSTIQTARSDSVLSTSGYMVLE